MRPWRSIPLALALSACVAMPEANTQATGDDAIASAFEEAATPRDAPKGLFAFLKRPPAPSPLEGKDISVSADAREAPQDAGLLSLMAPQSAGEQKAPPAPGSGGFFAALTRPSGTTASTVAPGEILPFGKVGIACDVSRGQMGKRVASYPERASKWKLFDTNPETTAPRTQFITGFSDGCARQVTASLVLFGAPRLHEVHRYSDGMKSTSWSAADKRYEVIKRQVCGVGKGTPCPAGRSTSLSRSLAFVSVYPQFGTNSVWLELLLHDGKLETQERR